MSREEQVPEEWRTIGFSGLFTRRAPFVEGVTGQAVADLEADLPMFSPGTGDNVMILRVDREAQPPSAVLVWKDAAALAEVMFASPFRSSS